MCGGRWGDVWREGVMCGGRWGDGGHVRSLFVLVVWSSHVQQRNPLFGICLNSKNHPMLFVQNP